MRVRRGSSSPPSAEVLAYLARRYPANDCVWHGEHEACGDALESDPPAPLTFWGLFGGVRWSRATLAMLCCLPKAGCHAVARAVGASK